MESTDGSQKKTKTESSESSGLQFVDEKFEVTPGPAPTSIKPEAGAEKEPGAPSPSGIKFGYTPDYTEEEVLFLSESLWSIPGMFLDKLPERNPEKVRKWNHQLYLYCIKKGINPFEYVADELPLVIVTAAMAGNLWRDYKEAYRSGNGKEKGKPADKLPSDIELEKQAAEQKAAHIEEAGLSEVAQATSS